MAERLATIEEWMRGHDTRHQLSTDNLNQTLERIETKISSGNSSHGNNRMRIRSRETGIGLLAGSGGIGALFGLFELMGRL